MTIFSVQRAARTSTRVRNLLLLVLLSVLITFIGLKITFVVEERWGHDAFVRWFGLAGFTLIMFALFVAKSEELLRKLRFWLLTSILLAGHLAAFAIVLTHVEEWKLMWFTVMAFEYPLFLFFRDKFVNSDDSE